MPLNPNESSSPPRYVDHPARRRAWRHGQRNLAWGVAFLFAALSLVGVAIFVGGPGALLPLLFCGLSFTTLWVLAKLKIFSQRNGVFFSLAVVALIGALATLVQQVWPHLGRVAGSSAEPRVATNIPTAQGLSANAGPMELPNLIEALKLETPDSALPRVRAARDLTTTIGGRSYRINRGDIFLYSEEKGGEVALAAGEFLARVPSNAVEMLAPEPGRSLAATAKPEDGQSALEKQANAEITARAQKEVTRRFPGVGKKGSPENRAFVDAVSQLSARRSDLLDDPEWPIELAQTLAHRLGWKESGVIEDEAPQFVEPSIAPGTRVQAEPAAPAETFDPNPLPITPPSPQPEPASDPDIPPPPRVPQ